MNTRPTFVALALLLLGACSGNKVNEQVCSTRDWQTLGYRDGVNGLRSSTLLNHQESCAKHGIVSDRAAYMAGWQEGVDEYCEADNGFSIGEQGWDYLNVCPQDAEPAFLEEYRKGHELFVARAEVQDLEYHIEESERRLEWVKSRILASASAQFDPMLTPQGRVDLISETQRLNNERRDIEQSLPGLRQDLETKQRKLESLSRALAAR